MSLIVRRITRGTIVIALLSSLLSVITTPAKAITPPSSQTCAQGGPCVIGDVGPGGGNVFYVAPTTFTQVGATAPMCTTNCKYLEAAPTSGTNAWTDNSYVWSDVTNVSMGTKGIVIGTGFNNTVAMVTQSATANRAVSITRAYRGPNNLSDWHLASKDELNQMCRWERGQSVSDSRCDGGTINSGRGAAGFAIPYQFRRGHSRLRRLGQGDGSPGSRAVLRAGRLRLHHPRHLPGRSPPPHAPRRQVDGGVDLWHLSRLPPA